MNNEKSKSELLYKELIDTLISLGPHGKPIFNYNEVEEGKEQDYLDNLILKANTIFKELYEQSIKDTFYWQYCPLQVYEETFNVRFSKYQNKYLDSDKNDFINKELDFVNSYSDLFFKIEFDTIPDKFGYKPELKFDIPLPVYLHPDIIDNIEITQNKKIEFLNNVEIEKESIVTILRKNDLLPENYEKEFILLINNKLDNKIRYKKDLPHWKLWMLIVFFIDNGFIQINKYSTEIKDFICNHFEYDNGGLKSGYELKKLIERYPSKLEDQIHKKDDYLKKMMFFVNNNNRKFSLK